MVIAGALGLALQLQSAPEGSASVGAENPRPIATKCPKDTQPYSWQFDDGLGYSLNGKGCRTDCPTASEYGGREVFNCRIENTN